jgi:hypothetical protein
MSLSQRRFKIEPPAIVSQSGHSRTHTEICCRRSDVTYSQHRTRDILCLCPLASYPGLPGPCSPSNGMSWGLLIPYHGGSALPTDQNLSYDTRVRTYVCPQA